MTQQKTVLNWISVCLLALLLVGSFTWMAPVNTEDKSYPTAEEIAELIVLPEIGDLDNDKINEMYNNQFADDLKESVAEALVLEEMDSRSFNKAVFAALEITETIDSYKDITNIVIKDIETTLVGDEDASVDVEIKVYYFVDGDEDEKEKALIEFTINVEDLVEDDEFEDAEIDDDYTLDVAKIYS